MGRQSVFIPFHRGSNGFMSVEQFEIFYRPQLKGDAFIHARPKPCPVCEGVWNQRLESWRELARAVGMFQAGDMFKVKEVAGNLMTIRGGFP